MLPLTIPEEAIGVGTLMLRGVSFAFDVLGNEVPNRRRGIGRELEAAFLASPRCLYDSASCRTANVGELGGTASELGIALLLI